MSEPIVLWARDEVRVVKMGAHNDCLPEVRRDGEWTADLDDGEAYQIMCSAFMSQHTEGLGRQQLVETMAAHLTSREHQVMNLCDLVGVEAEEDLEAMIHKLLEVRDE